jgi:hypothetical protein
MRRYFFALLCLTLCAPVWARRAATKKQASSSSSSSPSVNHSTTAKKTSSTKRRRRRSTKFVPKQKAPTPERISEIQTALSHGGYYSGDPNGKWDSNTVAALQKFQSANGIEPTGKLDAPSLQKLGLGSDIAGVSAPRPITPASQVPQSSAPASHDDSPKLAAPSSSSGSANTAGPSTAQETQPSSPAPSGAGSLAAKAPQQ